MRTAFAAACLLASALVAAADEPPRHLIYLHGRIVQDQQSARPRDPEFGYYELEAILKAFRDRGFVVTGEMRPKGTPLDAAADHVSGQVRALLASGIPASRITVLGGSMGAAIALRASVKLQNPDLNFCVLGPCMALSAPELLKELGARPSGRVLAIREKSDEMSEPCPAWSDDNASRRTLLVREIVLETGLRHGFLYRPLPEWVEPVVDWARAR